MSIITKIKKILADTFGDTFVHSLTSSTFVKGNSVEATYVNASESVIANNIGSQSVDTKYISITNNDDYILIGVTPGVQDPEEQFLMTANACIGNLQITGSSEDANDAYLYVNGTTEIEKALLLPRYIGNTDRNAKCINPQAGTIISIVNEDGTTAYAVQVYDGKDWRTLNWS